MSDTGCGKRLLAICAVSIFAMLGSPNGLALELPGIPPSGSPAFINSVKVHLNTNTGALKVTGKKDFLFDNGTSFLLDGNSAKYSLLANFDSGGTLLSGGTVSLRGGISILGIPQNTLLMTADLSGSNLLDNTSLWGFSTANLWCDPMLLVNCTDNESVYIELDTPFGGFSNGVFKASGMATTTIPIPASMWLFGTGLALLYVVRRRTIRTD